MDQQWCVEAKKYPLVPPLNKAAAKGSLKSYFRLQLLQKFIRCVCQVLMKLLIIEAASSTDLSFLPGAQSTPAVWWYKYCYTLKMSTESRYRLIFLTALLPMFSIVKKKANKPTLPAFPWNPSFERASGWLVSLFSFLYWTRKGQLKSHPVSIIIRQCNGILKVNALQ